MSNRIIVRAGWFTDQGLLRAMQSLYAYDDCWPDRATGWLYDRDGVLLPHQRRLPWPVALSNYGPIIMNRLHDEFGIDFSVCCYQAYRNGTGCHWHRDPEWGMQGVLSLGVTRGLAVRTSRGERYLPLYHGDLVIFNGSMEHSVPVEDAPGERVALVFREQRKG